MYRRFRSRVVKLSTYVKPEILYYSFLAFFYSVCLSAQSYSGALIVQDSLSFPYYISFDQQNLSGYSVSDITGDTETLSLIIANLLDDKKYFEIEESQVIYTKLDSESYDDFCKILFKTKLDSKSIDTEFEAVMSDGSTCGNGLIKLEDTEKLTNKLKKIKSKIQKNAALKTLTSESDRNESVDKIKLLLQLSVSNYSNQIKLNPEDFFDFIYFKDRKNISFSFDKPLSDALKTSISIKNSSLNQNENSFEIIKTPSSARASLSFNNENFSNTSFIIKINQKLYLRFLFPSNFKKATFIF